ncbi:UbiA family prenyltransferase [Ensifer adhaerens]|uniref:UbiA family prenyltransferase n=1 Tax=Ensifer adhaerens TaxID=106592 RepID=UPI001CBB0792|nr:UbiA family prenyltransferase [Ensifer adhaerens]MBZ7921329.1 UbiA family prenyltransferase [Ensifer adhaerens]UAX93760.1 UbiA family prenyltransferase [Ensifer adhaerens]UAY01396.1 UbiA family prenyltransferase [Ensifer adhaerens]UAY08778.1 UbiA family prenyltransferase [Ensifer adhaerens]
MDARTETRHIPLCVDLDGTLLAADTLWEGAAIILLRNPLMLFPMLFWLAKGKARLKHEVALRSGRRAQDWPYRQAVIDRLTEEKKTGRELVLVTGAAPSVARDIADHVGLFSSVMHSTDALNLTSSRKRQALVDRFGDGAFDYMGNSRDDIAVFEAARRAIVVAPDAAAEKWRRNHDAECLDTGKVSVLAPLKSIRVHQWAKNVLIGVPMILNHEVLHFDAIVSVIIAFFAFSFLASAVYVVNDLSDLSNDRRHAKKRHRPLASGQMSVPTALTLAGCLVLASLSLTLLLPWKFAGVLAFYAFATTAYTFVLKRKLLVDVFTLAGLYTTRIVAGAAATGTELSFWLVSFAIFFFLSLALVKRYVELHEFEDKDGGNVPGRGYLAADFEMVGQAGVASAFTAALVLALYVHSKELQEMYTTPWALWPLCPLVLYMLLRIWMLARRGMLHEDPVVFIMRDWRSQLTMLVGALLILFGAIGPQ